MKLTTAQALVEASMGSDHELDLYENYSGRGMYGESTAGVVCDDFAAFATALAAMLQTIADDEPGLCDRFIEPIVDEMRKLRHDSMGRQTIFY